LKEGDQAPRRFCVGLDALAEALIAPQQVCLRAARERKGDAGCHVHPRERDDSREQQHARRGRATEHHIDERKVLSLLQAIGEHEGRLGRLDLRNPKQGGV
jgi:hypothetical protein